MCGIFGYISKEKNLSLKQINRKTDYLFKLSESRGKEAAGLAVTYGNSARVFKGNLPASRMIRTKEYKDFFNASFGNQSRISKRFSLIGHSRLVTNGSQERNENNQPVIKDGLIMVHNGIISNTEALYKTHPDIQRLYEIDTEVLSSLIKKFLNESNDLADALRRAFQDVEGTATIAVLFEEFDTLLLATNNSSLHVCQSRDKGSCVFASERYILRRFLERNKTFDGEDILGVSPWSGVSLALTSLQMRPFALENEEETIPLLKRQEPFKIEDLSPVFEPADLSVVFSSDEQILEYNIDAINRLRRCSRCILPETFPFIEFDSQGVCNYCHNYKRQMNVPAEEQARRRTAIEEIVRKYKREGEKGGDVLVPFSGGRDSSYGLHVIKNHLGLNPVTFTYDWGMVTDLARRNIARLCGKLGVENIIVSADIKKKRKYIRQNVAAWLKNPQLGIVPLFMSGDKYFFYYLNRLKKETGIRLNIWMDNRLEATDFKVGFAGIKPKFDKKWIYSMRLSDHIGFAGYYFKNFLRNPRYFNSSILDTLGAYYIYYSEPRLDTQLLYDYIPWDEDLIKETLIKEYNWETAPDTKSFWRIGDGTAAFYNYIYYTMAGFSEIDTFRSNQVREGMLSRQAALEKGNEENRPRHPSIKWYLETIGLDFDAVIRAINAAPKRYAR